jgi:hypothetical protein
MSGKKIIAGLEDALAGNGTVRQARTVYDPFISKEVEISNRLVDRLRGRYAVGPTMPNGEPEFGWRYRTAPPHVPRFRALALFGRRPQERVDSVGIPASKNLVWGDWCQGESGGGC